MGTPAVQLQRQALADEITTLYAHINAATCRLLELIAEFDAQGLYVYFNAVSTAHWLNWACGIGLAAGREKVRVARALGELPVIHRAFSDGELSYSKVRALTRVATPACEETLLDMARNATAAQTERIMRNYRTALSLDGPQQRLNPERALTCHWDEHGCLSIRGRLTPEQGATFLKAMERAIDEVADPEDPRTPWDQQQDYPVAARRADALVVLSERALTATSNGGSTADRFQVAVHVSAETLVKDVDDLAPGDELPGIDNGPVIGPERARRLCCDGSVIPILESAQGEVLSIGRKSRTVPSALRRALKRRDGGCRYPGCEQRRWVDAHHVVHWAKGGETSLSNTVLLCRRHHTAVHEGGYRIRTIRTERGMDFQFVDPLGEVVPNCAEDLTTGDWQTLIENVSAETPGIHARTPIPCCDWHPPDYDHIAWWMTCVMRR